MTKSSSNYQFSWQSICLTLIAIFCTTVGLIYLKGILIPFVFSIFLYFLVSPVIDFFQLKGNLPRFFSTALTIFIGLFMASVLLFSFFISIKLFAPEAGNYQIKLLDFAHRLKEFLEHHEIEVGKDLLISNLSNVPVVGFIKSLTSSLVGFLGNSLLVLVILLFLIEGKDPKRVRNAQIQTATNRINEYVRGKFIVSVGTGLLVWLILLVLGVDLAGMFGVLTFLLNFIPSVGSVIAIMLPLPIVLLEYGFGAIFMLSVILPGAVQFAVGNVLEPKIMGDKLGLHPVVQLFSLLFWGAVWGVSGMFLAVPLIVVLKLFLEQFKQTQVLANLLEGKLSL